MTMVVAGALRYSGSMADINFGAAIAYRGVERVLRTFMVRSVRNMPVACTSPMVAVCSRWRIPAVLQSSCVYMVASNFHEQPW